MGRPKKPSELHELEGTARKDRHGDSGVQFPPLAATTKPPAWLGKDGKAKWTELVGYMSRVDGLLAELDAEAIAAYCEAWQEFCIADGVLKEDGLICISEKGGQYQHPMVGIKNQALKRMDGLRSKFGMTPTARAQLSIVGGGEDDDPFADMLKARMSGN